MWIFGSPKLDSNMDGTTAPILHWDPIASTFAQLLPHLDTQHCSHQVSQDWPWIAGSFASRWLWVDVLPSKWENGSMELAMCQSKQKCQKCFHAMQIDGSITNWCFQTHAMQILLVWYFWQHPLPAGLVVRTSYPCPESCCEPQVVDTVNQQKAIDVALGPWLFLHPHGGYTQVS